MRRGEGGTGPRPSRTRGSLLLRSIRSRRRLYAATILAAMLTVAAAALGPIFARAAAESTLRDVLLQADAQATGLHLAAVSDNGSPVTPLADFDTLSTQAPKPGSIRGYPTAWSVLRYGDEVVVSAAAGKQPTGLVWRTDACRHMTISAGRCPTAAGETMISARTVTAGGPGWRLGASVRTAAGPLKVVGVYRPRDLEDPYWFGVNYFQAGITPKGDLAVDSLFVAHPTMERLPPGAEVTAAIDYPLDASHIRLADVPRLRAAVAHLRTQDGPISSIVLSTDPPDVLASAAHQQQLVDTGTVLVTLQLTALGWLVLFLILADLAEARGAEIALAKLRGQSRSAVVRFGLAEPLVVLLAALPLGLVLGGLAALAIGAAVLLPGTPVVPTWSAIGTALLAFAGALAGSVVAGVRVLRRPVVEQWRRTAPRRTPVAVVVVELLVAAAAIAGLVRLRTETGADGGTAALLAPALLVIAVALVGVRVMPLVVRLALPPTRSSRRIGLFLATRQVARRPAATRLATLMAVAVGLAAFAVGGESAAALNRTARADGELGASRVVSVGYDGETDPVSAVRAADPDGRWAMAAATWLPDGGDTVVGTVLGVDTPRLPRVALPVAGGLPVSGLARAVTSGRVPALVIRATRLTARVTARDLHGVAPSVELDLRSRRGADIAATAEPLRAGTHDYGVAVPCAAGCTFIGVSWVRPVSTFDPLSGVATLSALTATSGTTTRPVAARLTDPSAWRAAAPVSEAKDRVTVSSAGVTDRFSSDSGYGGIAYASVPAVLPMVAAPRGLGTGALASAGQMVDEFGTTADVRAVANSAVLPSVLDAGVLMDVSDLDGTLPDFVNEATWQVWLSSAAPPDALQRLAHAGLYVGTVHTTAERRAELARQGPALSFLLLLVSAVAGAVLAALGTAVAISAASRRRSYELAATRVLGVGDRQLWSAAAGEQALLLGTAALLGIPGGVAAALLALPILPEFADPTPIALTFAPQPLPVAAFTAAFLLLLAATALVGASAVVRAARPTRLREAEE
ncbi:MAG: FtsX-like permease family protein [Amnibacterium sp.]